MGNTAVGFTLSTHLLGALTKTAVIERKKAPEGWKSPSWVGVWICTRKRKGHSTDLKKRLIEGTTCSRLSKSLSKKELKRILLRFAYNNIRCNGDEESLDKCQQIKAMDCGPDEAAGKN